MLCTKIQIQYEESPSDMLSSTPECLWQQVITSSFHTRIRVALISDINVGAIATLQSTHISFNSIILVAEEDFI